MKTFDYEKAWQELALPQFKRLPNAALCLAEEVALVAAELHQLPDCSMPWPEDGGKLRGMFDKLDSETLSRAALVVYHYGHWRPECSIAGNAPTLGNAGGSWKFSHYADQVLRGRFNISGRDSKAAVSLQIHEGTIRLCYSSDNMWTWHEVAPATEAGHAAAVKLAVKLREKLASVKTRDQRDSAAYEFIEGLNGKPAWPDWDTSVYMVEECELELRRAARMPKPDKAKLIAEAKQDFDKTVANATAERDGMLWLIEHDIPTGNAIYYKHTGCWCFGWRNPITGDARIELLAKLAKFPFQYDVK